MNAARDRLLKIINEIPESQLAKILDFAEYIKDREEKKGDNDLIKASESSLDFWNNELDDEVWNDV